MRNPVLVILYIVGGLFTTVGFTMLLGATDQYQDVLASAEDMDALSSLAFGAEAMQVHVSNMLFSGVVFAIGVIAVLLALTATAIGRTLHNLSR